MFFFKLLHLLQTRSTISASFRRNHVFPFGVHTLHFMVLLMKEFMKFSIPINLTEGGNCIKKKLSVILATALSVSMLSQSSLAYAAPASTSYHDVFAKVFQKIE